MLKTPPISVAYDPSQTGWVWLPRHEDLPEDVRPAFEVRFLTVRRNRAARDLYMKSAKAELYDEANRLIDEALSMLLVGWRNVVDAEGQAIVFPAELQSAIRNPQSAMSPLDDLGTLDEKRDLFLDLLHGMRFAELNRKKNWSSGSPLPPVKAPSAAPAE